MALDSMQFKGSIVFLVPGFPKDEADTECIPLLQNYIFYFAKLNPAVNIAVIAFQYPYFIGHYKWNNIDVYSAGGKNQRRIFRILTWLRAIFFFTRLRRRLDIAVIHSFWLDECAFVGQLLGRIFKIRHIATIGGQDAKSTNRYFHYLDFSNLTLTCWSQFSAAVFQKATGRKVEKIIPIGLDHRRFAASAATKERTIDILGVGALIPLKNFELFVEIIAELKNEFPGLRAKIIGDGPRYRHLNRLIQKNCRKNAELLGKLPRMQVIDYMSQSKILLHTSSFESQGYVFMEALYCGMTVVSFEVGHPGKTEKAINCMNKDDMVHALRKLLHRKLDYDRVLIKPIEETIEEYKALYAL